MKILTSTIAFCMMASTMAFAFGSKHAPYVPDSETAVKIAEVVLEKIYGKQVLDQRPFTSELKGETWIINGSIPKSAKGNYKGGTAYIEISQYDGRIQNMTHGK